MRCVDHLWGALIVVACEEKIKVSGTDMQPTMQMVSGVTDLVVVACQDEEVA